jgi:hypothetical protein
VKEVNLPRLVLGDYVSVPANSATCETHCFRFVDQNAVEALVILSDSYAKVSSTQMSTCQAIGLLLQHVWSFTQCRIAWQYIAPFVWLIIEVGTKHFTNWQSYRKSYRKFVLFFTRLQRHVFPEKICLFLGGYYLLSLSLSLSLTSNLQHEQHNIVNSIHIWW